MGELGGADSKAVKGPARHAQYTAYQLSAGKAVVLARGELGGSSLGICCNAEAAVLVMRRTTYLWTGRRGPPRSSLESFSAWVESLDKILKDLQALDGNRGTWGSQVVDPVCEGHFRG